MKNNFTEYDEMFNLIQDLEERAIMAESDVESEFLIALCNAIETTYGIDDARLGLI